MYTDKELYDYLLKWENRKTINKIKEITGRTFDDIMKIYDDVLADCRSGKAQLSKQENGTTAMYQKQAVKQYLADGTYVRTFESMSEAAKEMGNINLINRISQNCRGVSPTVTIDGYRYKFAKDVEGDNNLTPEQMKLRRVNISYHEKRVGKFDRDGTLLAVFPSLAAAGRSLDDEYKTKMNICQCCRGGSQTAYGYVWKYLEEETEEVKEWLKSKKKGDVNGNN